MNEPHEALKPGRGPRADRPLWRRALASVVDPVVPILLLAGLFDWLSGNPIHSILLFASACALGWDALRTHHGPVKEIPRLSAPIAPMWLVVMVGVLFAALIGEFGRYSWPATISVVVPAAAGVGLGWRGPLRPSGDSPRVGRSGGLAWATIFVVLGLWELMALLLQPSLTTDSYAHPTISVLTDVFLASHAGRSVSLFAWLGLGWFLVTA